MKGNLLSGSLGPRLSLFQRIVMKASFYRCNQVAYHKYQLPSIHPRIAGRRKECQERAHKSTPSGFSLSSQGQLEIYFKKYTHL